jgi:hypothetical protein
MAKYQKALTAEEAIERSIEFLKGLKPELLGSAPKNIRLEELQEGRYWVVALSYETDLSPERIIKEVSIAAKTGKIIAFLNGSASSTSEPNVAEKAASE